MTQRETMSNVSFPMTLIVVRGNMFRHVKRASTTVASGLMVSSTTRTQLFATRCELLLLLLMVFDLFLPKNLSF